jgi:hypothetical protein
MAAQWRGVAQTTEIKGSAMEDGGTEPVAG